MAQASVQPDLMRPRQMPLLRELEAPRHYIDLELLQGNPLPESMSDYLKLIVRLADQGDGLLRSDWRLESVGILPYALIESTQRLSAIFAQLRREPNNRDLRSIALYQAGMMAHYAQDLCQPLHTTLHHDGRARSDGSSPGSGIHRQVDALLRSVDIPSIEGPSRGFDDLLAAVLSELELSHSRVDRVYELQMDLEAATEGAGVSSSLREFGLERYRQSIRFTAELLHTAWLLSETIELPGWATD